MYTRVSRLIALAIGLTFAVGMLAYAQAPRDGQRTPRERPGMQQQPPPEGMNPEFRPRMMLGMAPLTRLLAPPGLRELERLGVLVNLTPEQKETLRGLYEVYMNRVRPIHEQRAPAVRGVLDIIQSPAPSKSALQTAANPVQQFDSQILDAQFDFWIGFRAMLNPEQQAQAEAFIQRHFQMMDAPRGPGTGPPGPPPPGQ